MKVIFYTLLAFFISSNVVAENKFTVELDKQTCSQENNYSENNASIFTPNSEYKVANMKCGFKPFTPFGCSKGYAVCSCDSSGNNCQWVWMGCG